jgi:hypothetical protein
MANKSKDRDALTGTISRAKVVRYYQAMTKRESFK